MIVYGIVEKYGVDGLTICTVLAGILLVAMGLARFGGAIKFIPYPVVTGFTSGIAVIIFSSQIKDLLGLKMGEVPGAIPGEVGRPLRRTSARRRRPRSAWPLGSLAILLLWPKISRRKFPVRSWRSWSRRPAVAAFSAFPVETIGSRFGEIHASIPAPRFPDLSLDRVRELFSPAVTVALLAAIESLLSAVVADGMIGSRHKSNVELVGQGIANIASGLFGGHPGHRRHRPHGDQHQERRPHAGGRHGPRR